MAISPSIQFGLCLLLFGSAIADFCPTDGTTPEFVAHPDCTKYVRCDTDEEIVMSCPTGLYFNPSESYCDFPANVVECVGGTRPPKPTTTVAPDPNVLTECGQTIVAGSGRIDYKVGETYGKLEVCSFIIRNDLVGDMIFTLESHGINKSDTYAINIFTFNENGVVDTVHMGPPNPVTEAFVSGSSALVVFKTGTKAGLGTGFSLSFRNISSSWYGTRGHDLISGNLTGELTIPFWEQSGGSTSLIVLSAEHKSMEGTFNRLRLTWTRENFQKHISRNSCGYDRVMIYSFTSQTLESLGKFCSITDQRAVYETAGLMILVFRDFEDNYWYTETGTFKWEIFK